MRFDNPLVKHLLTHYPWLWRGLSAIPWLRSLINRVFIDLLTRSGPPRPHPYSLWGPQHAPAPPADYITWTGLVDRVYTGRHLPPAEPAYGKDLPGPEQLGVLFRREGAIQACPESSALFGFFAQWFTDSFLRTDPNDTRKNTSNHEIDLCQIYGLSAHDTNLIRSHRGGELKSQKIGNQEFPPFLFNPDGLRVRDEFLGLSYIADGDFPKDLLPKGFDTPERKAQFFVTGLERGNSTVHYSAINTIFLREHNRLCRALTLAHPDWDDDRLFETARNVNIVQLLKVIVEDYINVLSPTQFKMFVEVGFAERQDWYRTNRICAEFNLLYRWHQLVPTELDIGGQTVANTEFRFNNAFLFDQGLESVVAAAAVQRAGRIRLKNSAPFLVPADLAAVAKSRAWRIQPYNAYRKRFRLAPVQSFEELTGDTALAQELRQLYGHVDRVEFMVGLLAEARDDKAMLGSLMMLMVGVDAFSQALTNPLLSKNVYGPQAFSELGLASIDATSRFGDIVQRNTALQPRQAAFAVPPAPGSFGLPLIGTLFDTLDFFLISGWEQFFRRRQRAHASSVFKINLFQPTIALLDSRAISALFASGDLVPDRPDAGFQFQLPPLPLLGGVAPGMFETGLAHDQPKALYLRLLQRRSATLVAEFDRSAHEYLQRWQTLGRFSFRDELETFTLHFAFRWLLGAQPDPIDVRKLFLNNMFSHVAVAITKHMPWSAYARAQRDYQRLVDFVKASPAFDEIRQLAEPCGLSDPDHIAKQISYLMGTNVFLGIQNLLKSVIGELSLHPDWHAALREEITSAFGASPQGADLRRLGELPKLDRFLREVLRLHPPVFFVFGRATQDRVLASASGPYLINKDQLLMGVMPLAQRDASLFPDPDRFDPDRFLTSCASQHLIWPRGPHDGAVSAHDRTCPGKDVAVLIAKLFCHAVLPRTDWALKQPPTWGRRLFVLNVAAPQGALDVERFTAIAPAPQGPEVAEHTADTAAESALP